MTRSNASAHQNPSQRSPYVVALTGGIASGKTAVSDRFAKLGVPVIDTDIIAHEVVEPGQPALQAVADAFGTGILQENGQLNRSVLRKIIFSDKAARKTLESILHPAIRTRVQQAIAAVVADYCLVVIPLFTETNSYNWVNRILVVDTSEETQVQRVMQRDGVDRKQAEAALASQASRQSRLALADDVIENNGVLTDLEPDILKLHDLYSDLARNRA